MIESKDGAGVNDRYKTIPDEFQYVYPRDFHEHGVIQQLFGKNYCTNSRGECLDLVLFEIMEWSSDNSGVQEIQLFKSICTVLVFSCFEDIKALLRIFLKKVSNSCCPDKHASSTRNQIIKSLIHPCIFHICSLELLLEEYTNVIGDVITRLDILARENIDMCANGIRECLGNMVLWLAGNNHLELL